MPGIARQPGKSVLIKPPPAPPKGVPPPRPEDKIPRLDSIAEGPREEEFPAFLPPLVSPAISVTTPSEGESPVRAAALKRGMSQEIGDVRQAISDENRLTTERQRKFDTSVMGRQV